MDDDVGREVDPAAAGLHPPRGRRLAELLLRPHVRHARQRQGRLLGHPSHRRLGALAVLRGEIGVVLPHPRAPRQQLAGGHARDLHAQVPHQHFNFEAQVELQALGPVDLRHELHEGHGPRVRRLENFALRGRLDHIVNEGNDRNHLPLVVRLQHHLLQVEVLGQDRLAPADGEQPQPKAQVLEHAPVAAARLQPVGGDQALDVGNRRGHHDLVELLLPHDVQQLQIEVVKIGLLGRPLGHEVVREPREVLPLELLLHLGALRVQVALGQVVHEEVNLVGECLTRSHDRGRGFGVRLVCRAV
mmetsp:Transcript_17719/g.49873  ORF Transcript_17719/g.49873 Transcript_17719/m.49873 type:complete len:302 (-) Transcript_17719:34-939(-)